MCDEDFGSEEEEGDVESYLEDNSSELMDRLRELEAENSALMLANESQREAYERCLDEVANHVVQALLNQKDLREECIKLKMLVFDLERQNRALCELFQQKLPNQPPAHCQVQAGPLPDCGTSLHQDAAKQAEPPHTDTPAKGNGYRAPHAASPSSLEALSPFLRKKAHILEVLRRMEESDPLKFHPSATSSAAAAAGLTFCDYSQVLVSTEAVLAAAAAAATTASEPLPLQRTHRHCSCSEGDAHQLNGGPDPAPNPTAAKPCSHHACCPPTAAPQGHAPPLEGAEPENCEKAPAGVCPVPETAAVATAQHCDPEAPPPAEPDQDQDPDTRAGASVSPAPASCLSEVKAAAISSPSKLLKFLKLPSLAERRPAPPSPTSSSAPAPPSRLSPQLTRTSRIPCRTNNYEVYHSPVPARRAATAERCRPPPPPPCRSESYPAPRSAPTSPPPPPPPSEDVGTRTTAAAAVSAPHYENIPDDVVAAATALPSSANRKLVKSLPDGVLSPAPPQRRPASSPSPSSSSSTSEDSDDSDSPVWVSHHGLAVEEKGEGEEEEEGPPATPAPPPPPPPPPARRSDSSSTSSSSIPKRPAGGAARPQPDAGHHAFQDRLAALGKLRGCDDLQGAPRPPGAPVVEEPRPPEATVASAGVAGRVRGSGLKVPSGSRAGPPSPNADAPQVLRSNIRGPASLHLKTPPPPGSSSSPSKVPPKSPSRPPTHHRAPRGPPEAPRYSSRSEERVKVGGKGRKNPVYGDSLPPPPPRPPPPEGGGPPLPAAPAATPTAMEQKVMKGIEENMLKLQEQDRGAAPASEVKHKTSNGIASWFGLKKSKLPALNRRAAKDDKKEWKINIPSVGGARKEGVEGLNISTLMEKAEGLRRALEEERAYVERSGRGHSCEVVLDQSQGQLAVMYRGGGGGSGVGGGSRSDNFMQQLLNRVDGKEVLHLPQRRLSFDCKASKFSQQSDILAMEKGSGRISKITSEENLSESVHLQRFAGSGASTYTLDSGIGTFPLPDCSGGAAAARGLSKMRGGAEHSGSPGRAGRRARTLDRELPVQEEGSSAHIQTGAGVQYGPAGAVVVREDKEAHGTNVFSQRTKTWTFPNLKAPAGPAEVYLAVEEEEEEPVSFGSPFRASLKASGPPSSSLPVPAQGPGLSRRGKTRAPTVPEVSREAGLELLRERPEEALSPSRPQVLETPESLSDSLYDSLSSCGSQG